MVLVAGAMMKSNDDGDDDNANYGGGGGGVLDDFGEKKVPSGEDAGKVVNLSTIYSLYF